MHFWFILFLRFLCFSSSRDGSQGWTWVSAAERKLTNTFSHRKRATKKSQIKRSLLLKRGSYCVQRVTWAPWRCRGSRITGRKINKHSEELDWNNKFWKSYIVVSSSSSGQGWDPSLSLSLSLCGCILPFLVGGWSCFPFSVPLSQWTCQDTDFYSSIFTVSRPLPPPSLSSSSLPKLC